MKIDANKICGIVKTESMLKLIQSNFSGGWGRH